jgi:hypothetical protein
MAHERRTLVVVCDRETGIEVRGRQVGGAANVLVGHAHKALLCGSSLLAWATRYGAWREGATFWHASYPTAPSQSMVISLAPGGPTATGQRALVQVTMAGLPDGEGKRLTHAACRWRADTLGDRGCAEWPRTLTEIELGAGWGPLNRCEPGCARLSSSTISSTYPRMISWRGSIINRIAEISTFCYSSN